LNFVEAAVQPILTESADVGASADSNGGGRPHGRRQKLKITKPGHSGRVDLILYSSPTDQTRESVPVGQRAHVIDRGKTVSGNRLKI